MDASANLLEKIRNIISEVLDMDKDEFDYESDFITDLSVSSLMSLEVMVAIERKFGIRISEDEMNTLRSLKRVHELVTSKIEEIYA